MHAVNKRTGARIRGTYEVIHGVAEVTEDSYHRDADGNIAFDHKGETEVFWDDSVTVRVNEKVVFLDEHGHDITQDDIILMDSLPEQRG